MPRETGYLNNLTQAAACLTCSWGEPPLHVVEYSDVLAGKMDRSFLIVTGWLG